jgi:hypothetical protein
MVCTPLTMEGIIRDSSTLPLSLHQSFNAFFQAFPRSPSHRVSQEDQAFLILHLPYHSGLHSTAKMHLTNTLLFASTAIAFSFPTISYPKFSAISNLVSRKDGGSSCPAVWKDISKNLTAKFLTAGQCNQDARAAIREVFHDCGGKSQISFAPLLKC